MDGTDIAELVIGVFLVCILISRFLFHSRMQSRRRRDARIYRRNAARRNAVVVAPPSAETWPQVLQVDARANTAEIRRAYRVLISRYHPDRMSDMDPALREQAARRSQEINSAYREALAARATTPV